MTSSKIKLIAILIEKGLDQKSKGIGEWYRYFESVAFDPGPKLFRDGMKTWKPRLVYLNLTCKNVKFDKITSIGKIWIANYNSITYFR